MCRLLVILTLLFSTGAWSFPISTSQHFSDPNQSIYLDGYQVNGTGQTYSWYREKQSDNSWGNRQELKLDTAATKSGLQNGTLMLEGYNETTNNWVGYTGNGNDLVAHNTNYGWKYGYQLSFDGTLILADIQIEFDWTNSGVTNDQVKTSHMSLWEQNIERWWSSRFEVVKDDQWHFPILFDLTYDGYADGSFDQKVKIFPGSGRANVGEWYLTDDPQTNAHEFGHMLGLFDEYWLGAIDPVTKQTDYVNLMGAAIGALDFGTGLEDYYFSKMLTWLDSIDPDPTQTFKLQRISIPEPGILSLLLIGFCLAFFSNISRAAGVPKSLTVTD